MQGFLYRARRKLDLETRRLTAALRYEPNLLIIGAQKAGTSSLYDYLAQHPQIGASPKKEVNYFHANFDRDHAWYRGHFPLHQTGDYEIVLEATPSYIPYIEVAQRVAQIYPKMKIIALLRHPVHRAYSHYKMHLRLPHYDEPLSFEEAIAAEPERIGQSGEDGFHYTKNFDAYSYLARGQYWTQLKYWYEVFPREQIRVYQAEVFFEQTAAVYSDILGFLGVSDFHPQDLEPKNQSGASRNVRDKIGDALYDQLLDYFDPHNEALYQNLGQRFDWD